MSDPLTDPELVRRVARLARLGLQPAELDAAGSQLVTIIGHFRALQEVETRGVEPLVHAVDRPGEAVADEVVAQPDPRRDLLGLTHAAREGFFVVPRVMDADFGAAGG
ncbi:MAG TPA: Asp-tRNA(Asn)/Glu-tRNA(Gln) amidotransferase subunit GatC [Planctomycetota bacterium]|nr:Asp-tRNA(Asn)/Glu-tRNA(Gln) amidotransferase subunit GatC [Planctomycetota bacterium]